MSPFNYFYQSIKCVNERDISAIYSDLEQKETLQTSLSTQNLKSPFFSFTDLEKEEYANIFPGIH